MKLSVLIPVYNERPWVEECVKRVMSQSVTGVTDLEIILVDDGSGDGTDRVLLELKNRYSAMIKIITHLHNKGKGACIRSAVKEMTGDICIIQDADLEYNPMNYPVVLQPLIDGLADCVYGSRFQGDQPKRVLMFRHYMGNRFLTFLSNLFTNINLSDMETGYKAFRCDVIKKIRIVSDRFGFEPEITAKMARARCRMYEVGISYFGRTYAEGKKITWFDGIKAIFIILRFWIWP
jgi:glycosyltransferase involved in cell wall biosynthesis